MDTDITKWLKIGIAAQFADRGNKDIVADTGNADGMSPYASMYEEDGSIKKYPTDDARIINPLLTHSVDKKFY